MTLSVDGATRLILIIGDPIAQVKSPAGMSAAFAARGNNTLCVPVHVAPADLAEFVQAAASAQNIDGLLITIPHKFAAHELCAATTERAHFLKAVQTMRRHPDGGWFGENVDGIGFVAGLRNKGCNPQGTRALLVGAGGAGSAIAFALLEAGVSALAITDDDPARRQSLIGKLATRSAAPVSAGSGDPSGFNLIVNATPAGMRPDDPLPVDVSRLSADAFCGCVITSPEVSPFIGAARVLGCGTSTGADMYQGTQALMLDFLLPSG